MEIWSGNCATEALPYLRKGEVIRGLIFFFFTENTHGTLLRDDIHSFDHKGELWDSVWSHVRHIATSLTEWLWQLWHENKGKWLQVWGAEWTCSLVPHVRPVCFMLILNVNVSVQKSVLSEVLFTKGLSIVLSTMLHSWVSGPPVTHDNRAHHNTLRYIKIVSTSCGCQHTQT